MPQLRRTKESPAEAAVVVSSSIPSDPLRVIAHPEIAILLELLTFTPALEALLSEIKLLIIAAYVVEETLNKKPTVEFPTAATEDMIAPVFVTL